MSPLTPQSPQAADPLAQLRDIHLPQESISNLPLAPGWWLLGLMILASLVAAMVFWRRHQTRNRYRSQALKELNRIQPGKYNDQKFMQLINTLLKRTSAAAYPGYPGSHLHGAAWLAFLQQSNPRQTMSRDINHFWLHSSYARCDEEIDNRLQQQTWQLAKYWIQQHQSEPKLLTHTNTEGAHA